MPVRGFSHGIEWTPERLVRVKGLTLDGKTSKEMAEILSKEWNIGVTESAVDNVRYIHNVKKSAEIKSQDGYVSIEKIISHYDIKSAIFRELQKIPKGKLISQNDLCLRAAGTDKYRFNRTLENNPDEFRAFRIKLKIDDSGEGKWYWGAAEDIGEALKMRDL